jgi:hypothetical protein
MSLMKGLAAMGAMACSLPARPPVVIHQWWLAQP